MADTRTHILVVEDNEGDARLLREDLSQDDLGHFEITWVKTLADALKAIETDTVDAVLLDLNLPDSFGLETLRVLRGLHPELPVVILSGVADENLAIDAVTEGAQDYLIKGKSDPDILSRAIIYAIERSRMMDQLKSMAISDELTGLYNRRGFETLATQQIRLARRNAKPFTLFYADLDGLKRINDLHGHQAGDRCIVDSAAMLTQAFRQSDILARIGGDEFTVLAIDCNREGAQRLAARIQEQVDAHNAAAGNTYTLSLSVGFAAFGTEDDLPVAELLKQADAALYAVKQARRA